MRYTKWVRRFILYPVLILGGLHTLLTGSPIPLWHIEELHLPTAVQATTKTHFVLEDGRTVALPFLKEIPYDNRVFQAAISHGIETTAVGEAYGLIWLDRACGNDPVVWRKVRVNLSELAGALCPTGIDDAIVHATAIDFLNENYRIDLSEPSRSHPIGHLTFWDLTKMRRIREQFEYSAEFGSEDKSATVR